jgi:hypothetical protein
MPDMPEKSLAAPYIGLILLAVFVFAAMFGSCRR